MRKVVRRNDYLNNINFFLDEDINLFGYEYLKTLRGETLETDGHLLIIRNSTIGTFHLPRSDEDEQDNLNVKLNFN
jgi:hypothetical protein